MSTVDDKFIVKLQGKEFILYNGLMDLAHKEGLISIDVDLIQIPTKENDMTAIAKATAKTKDKTFVDIGDAGPSSVNRMIAPHIIRMASTRAKARALRDLTNVGMTAFEEMMDEDEGLDNKYKPNVQSKKVSDADLASDKQLKFLYKLVKDKNYGSDAISKYIDTAYKKNSSKELTKKEASEIIEMLNAI